VHHIIRGLRYLISLFSGSSLLSMAYIVSLHASLVLPYLAWHCIASPHVSLVHHHWAWFASFDYEFHWFFFTGHGLHCFTSCFTGSFLLGIVCIFSLPSLFRHYWTWFILFDYALHWFFLTGHCLYCFSSCFIGSSLLGMICVVSGHASSVHPYWAWFLLFHIMLRGSSLPGMVCIVSFHA
jgi:hypothetical protein